MAGQAPGNVLLAFRAKKAVNLETKADVAQK
jgi:hypothetical protein